MCPDGWLVHAWVLMNTHYHLCIETPEANLVDGQEQRLVGQGLKAAGLDRRDSSWKRMASDEM